MPCKEIIKLFDYSNCLLPTHKPYLSELRKVVDESEDVLWAETLMQLDYVDLVPLARVLRLDPYAASSSERMVRIRYGKSMIFPPLVRIFAHWQKSCH
jgi:hypothetical protein